MTLVTYQCRKPNDCITRKERKGRKRKKKRKEKELIIDWCNAADNMCLDLVREIIYRLQKIIHHSRHNQYIGSVQLLP